MSSLEECSITGESSQGVPPPLWSMLIAEHDSGVDNKSSIANDMGEMVDDVVGQLLWCCVRESQRTLGHVKVEADSHSA